MIYGHFSCFILEKETRGRSRDEGCRGHCSYRTRAALDAGGCLASHPARSPGRVWLSARTGFAGGCRDLEHLPRRGLWRRHVLSRFPSGAARGAHDHAVPRRGVSICGRRCAWRARESEAGARLGRDFRRWPRYAGADLLSRLMRLRTGGHDRRKAGGAPHADRNSTQSSRRRANEGVRSHRRSRPRARSRGGRRRGARNG